MFLHIKTDVTRKAFIVVFDGNRKKHQQNVGRECVKGRAKDKKSENASNLFLVDYRVHAIFNRFRNSTQYTLHSTQIRLDTAQISLNNKWWLCE